MFSSQAAEVSFMHIYGQRTRVPGAIIIDGGSGYCKYGWSKYSSPSGRSATFMEFGNIMSPMPSRLGHFFFNNLQQTPMMCRMRVKTYTQPIVVSIPICHRDGQLTVFQWNCATDVQSLALLLRSPTHTESTKASTRQLKEAICSTLFDINVPAVCVVNQATLALFAARRTSGIVVNVGFHQTSVVPILHGKVMHQVGVEVVAVGALKLTGYLRDRMQQKNIHVDSIYTVRTLKENLCYVALNYEAELSKDMEASFQVASEGWFTLSEERFQTGEVLFQPRMAGVQTMGLHQAVALCMDHCHDAELTSGEIDERLEKELYGLLPASISSGIRIIPPPYGVDSAWFGAKLISNLSTFPGSWCMTKKEFQHWTRRKLMS
ncbi:Actin-related protein 8, partial [Abeliophyllum distichum]